LLEGHGAALVKLRLDRGLVAPSSEAPPRSGVGRPFEWDSASLGGWTPPRARSSLDRELNTPSSKVPSRSRTSRARCLHTCTPDRGIECTGMRRCTGQGQIYATTRLGIMPRHYSANSPGKAIPATVRRCAAWLATISWHCATHSRTADAPHPRKRTVELSKGRQTTTPRPHRTTP
jgi:hypothetical protein